jgi:hypothetical protein
MKKYTSIMVLFGCLAVLVLGIIMLFDLRFEAGDVYPEYSSLRADPLGTMAFYESLEKVPGLSVRRDFSASDRLPEESRTVYLHLAGERREWTWMDKELFRQLQDFLALPQRGVCRVGGVGHSLGPFSLLQARDWRTAGTWWRRSLPSQLRPRKRLRDRKARRIVVLRQ